MPGKGRRNDAPPLRQYPHSEWLVVVVACGTLRGSWWSPWGSVAPQTPPQEGFQIPPSARLSHQQNWYPLPPTSPCRRLTFNLQLSPSVPSREHFQSTKPRINRSKKYLKANNFFAQSVRQRCLPLIETRRTWCMPIKRHRNSSRKPLEHDSQKHRLDFLTTTRMRQLRSPPRAALLGPSSEVRIRQ